MTLKKVFNVCIGFILVGKCSIYIILHLLAKCKTKKLSYFVATMNAQSRLSLSKAKKLL